MKQGIFYLILFLIFSRFAFAQENYLFPLKENRELSSVFADHRDFHFHSGIDIKTGEKSGLEVYASKSGWVYRLFASWWGYGKAVYLKHPDGKLTVYAHLSDFSKKLKKIVTEKQLENRRYRVDIFASDFGSAGEDTIWIEPGELIGYSGETGTGDPHLHFEIRDENNRPLNPLTSGISIQDTISPVLQNIGIRPLDLNSSVNGSLEKKFYPLYFDSTENIYILKEIPIVKGRIGIELSAYDEMVEKGSKFGIYKLELYLDGLPVFSSQYDTIDFENSWKVELDRDFELLQKGEGEFYKLFIDNGNDLPLYHSFNRGILEFSKDSLHQIIIQAQDACGNFSRAKIYLRVADIYAKAAVDTKDTGIFFTQNQDKIDAKSEDKLASVEIDSGSVFKRINLQIKKIEKPEKVTHKLKSSLYSFSPQTIPLAKPAKISLTYKCKTCGPSKLGLYEYINKNFKFIGQEIDTVNNTISGKVRNLSTYALLEDKTPPDIKIVYPKQKQVIKGEELIISAWVRDELSGIGSDLDIKVFLDGEWLIPEYDPEKFILISRPFKTLLPGWHKLVIKAKDRMGNEKEVKSKFKVL
ncbi:MAG: M23 family metallopeptidase [candidate division Zixibacteria bacterium]|nr:M23 family metallopeptidase [candidate division Zixibacteria bacterium]